MVNESNRRMQWTHGSKYRSAVAAVAVALLAIAGVTAWSTAPGYRLEILMPSATGVIQGDSVYMGGRTVGVIDDVRVHGNKQALVTVEVNDAPTPMHQGTRGRVFWQATIRERGFELLPGPASAPELKSGSRVFSPVEPADIDQLLKALDKPTMNNVNTTVEQLQQTLSGREGDVSKTIQTGAPTIKALGEVLKAVGSDGPALRNLVTQLRQVTSTLAPRADKLSRTIDNLDPLTREVAGQQQNMSAGIAALPGTLQQAQSTLGRVPGAVNQTVPLLQDIRPATARLPQTAKNLNPVLQDLRPVAAQLRPTLQAAQPLLDQAPGMLDSVHGVLPPAAAAVSRAAPALSFLRPYTPELVGWLSNWNSLFASKTGTGAHYARALITESAASADENPGLVPPGMCQPPTPKPGSLAGNPCTDANGSGQR